MVRSNSWWQLLKFVLGTTRNEKGMEEENMMFRMKVYVYFSSVLPYQIHEK
jgi:hypothetical protein